MTQPKFTPGPWKRDGWQIKDTANRVIARVYLQSDDYELEALNADASLIAAAPEMYAALKNLENDDGKQMPKSAWALVQAALAKARGEEEQTNE